MEPVGLWEMILRLVMAILCAVPVGYERARREHTAGLRTSMLVSLASAAFVLVAIRFQAEVKTENGYAVDPMRVVQGLVSGLGLLAGGAIIQSGGVVKGMTTASSIWAVCAAGTACGIGQYDLAIAISVLTVVVTGILIYIDPKEHHLHDAPSAGAGRSDSGSVTRS